MKTGNLKSSLLAIAAVITLAFTAGNAAAQGSAAASQTAPQFSYGVPQVLQLVQAKISDGVIISYVQNSGTIYSLKASEIVYLKQQGVSDNVLNAMLNQRSRLTGSTEPSTATASSTPASAQADTPPAPAANYVQTAQPSTVYVIPDTQTYQYDTWYYGAYGAYPYYSYPYYGWPAVSLSFGWGGHYGGGWHGGGGYHGGGGGWHGGGGFRGGGGFHH